MWLALFLGSLQYIMCCFKLPLGLCHEIEKLIHSFWWGERGDHRKIHWIKREDMCEPKSEGGMGFKELSLFNDAPLAYANVEVAAQ